VPFDHLFLHGPGFRLDRPWNADTVDIAVIAGNGRRWDGEGPRVKRIEEPEARISKNGLGSEF
jgi:hypothetical protein